MDCFRIVTVIGLGLLLAACRESPPVRTVPYEDSLLSDVRAAVAFHGLASHRAGYELVGDRQEAGGTSSFRFVFDLAGRSCFDVEGPMPRATGFDGLRTWTQDATGTVRDVALGTRERIRCEAWLRTGLWLDPYQPRFAARIDAGASDSEAVAIELTRPGSPFRATIFVDRRTSLPLRYRLRDSEWIVELSEWRRIGLGRLPFRFDHVREDGGRVVEEVRVGTPTEAPSFDPPRPLAEDATFVAPSGDVPARLGTDGRLYAEVQVGSLRSAWMLVDSGFGATAVSRSLADAQRWPVAGEATLEGVGGRGTSRWRRSGELTFGPLRTEGLFVVELDAPPVEEDVGFPVEGVVGADILARAVLELDARAGTLRLHEPRLSVLPRELEWHELALDGTAPCVQGALGPHADVWLRLDTGSADTLSVAPWAVTEFDLARSTVDLEAVYLVGPFGALRGWRGELDGLTLGRVIRGRTEATFLDPVANDGGPLDDPWIAANVGLAGTHGLRVWIDVPRSRIALAKSPAR